MDFIRALLEVLIPSRAARAEMESLRLGLVRLAAVPTGVTETTQERMPLSGQWSPLGYGEVGAVQGGILEFGVGQSGCRNEGRRE